jgi:hypothetical protein
MNPVVRPLVDTEPQKMTAPPICGDGTLSSGEATERTCGTAGTGPGGRRLGQRPSLAASYGRAVRSRGPEDVPDRALWSAQL